MPVEQHSRPHTRIRIGVAGWSVPAPYRNNGSVGSHLEQYARYFDCVEINSSFYKPHLPTTFARWAACVPADFRFSVKLPKLITHEKRLVSCRDAVERFYRSASGLDGKLEVLLMQLPPSLAFDAATAQATLTQLRDAFTATIACEARHSSWFRPRVDRLLGALRITRVAADPAVGGAPMEVDTAHAAYVRLHGRPRVYYSAYSSEYLDALASKLKPRGATADVWCIFDNTALGAAWPNALRLKESLR